MLVLGLNYAISDYDRYVHYIKLSNGLFIYLLLYVDDMLIVAKNMSIIDYLKFQ